MNWLPTSGDKWIPEDLRCRQRPIEERARLELWWRRWGWISWLVIRRLTRTITFLLLQCVQQGPQRFSSRLFARRQWQFACKRQRTQTVIAPRVHHMSHTSFSKATRLKMFVEFCWMLSMCFLEVIPSQSCFVTLWLTYLFPHLDWLHNPLSQKSSSEWGVSQCPPPLLWGLPGRPPLVSTSCSGCMPSVRSDFDLIFPLCGSAGKLLARLRISISKTNKAESTLSVIFWQRGTLCLAIPHQVLNDKVFDSLQSCHCDFYSDTRCHALNKKSIFVQLSAANCLPFIFCQWRIFEIKLLFFSWVYDIRTNSNMSLSF